MTGIPDEQQIKKYIVDTYVLALDRKPDNKTITFWMNSISSGNKSNNDLVSFLMNSEEYKTRLLSKFKSWWFELIGFDIEDNMINTFLAQVSKNTNEFITEADIHKCIKHSTEYEAKCTFLITSLFFARHNRDPSTTELGIFLQRFRDENLCYSISMLESDIENITQESMHASSLETDTSTDLLRFCMRWMIEPTAREFIKEYNSTFLDRSDKTEQNNHMLTLDLDLIKDFEETFKRPIFVQEYAKYVRQKDNLVMETLLHSHLKSFGDMKEIFEKYHSKGLSEHEYISNYLVKMDDPNFINEFSQNIVLSDMYISKMKDKILARYLITYDEQLEPVDVDYIFEKVQNARVGLHDVWLDDFLLCFKNETDEIIKRVFSLYMTIYERAPDRSELFDKALYYRTASRKNEMFDAVDDAIERELMQCLEFHDVIKKRIKLSKADISVSMLFKVLSHIIDILPTLRVSLLDDAIRDNLCKL